MKRRLKQRRQLGLVTLIVGLLAVFGSLTAWQMASAADVTPTSIQIDGTTFNPSDGDKNGTGWRYAKDTNILTLENFNSDKIIIANDGDLRLKLLGNNVIMNKTVHAGKRVIITADSTGKLLIDVDGFSRSLIGAGTGYIQNGGRVELKQELNGQPVTNSASLLWTQDGSIQVTDNAELIVKGESDGAHSLCGVHALQTIDYEFSTSGKVEFIMRSTAPNDSAVVAVCGWSSNPQSKKLILLGSGQYSFESPVVAIKVPVEVRNGQQIAEPAGATIDSNGVIQGVTNFSKIVFKKPVVQSPLTIINGDANKPSPVAEGEAVSIIARPAPIGKVFDKWVVKSGGVVLNNELNETTTFTMGPNPVEIEATYKAKMINTTVNCGAHGTCTLTPAGTSHPYNTNLKLSIVANPGYVIDEITRNAIIIGEYSGKNKPSEEIDFQAIADSIIDITFKVKPAVIPPLVITDKPTLSQKDQLDVEVRNLAPEHHGKMLDIFINSTKTKLASLLINAPIMNTTVAIPCTITPGAHTITAEVNGVQVGTGIPLTVTYNSACKGVLRLPNSGHNQNVVPIAAVVAALGGLILVVFTVRKLAKK